MDAQGWTFAAEIYKAYLHCAATIVRSEGGAIVSAVVQLGQVRMPWLVMGRGGALWVWADHVGDADPGSDASAAHTGGYARACPATSAASGER